MRKKIWVIANHHLDPKHAAFVTEYIKDFAPRRAAEAVGFVPETGAKLLTRDDIAACLEEIMQQRLDLANIDADWLMWECIDNHHIARQHGNLAASNAALGMLAKHRRVDAFAADKVMVTTDSDVMERLMAARTRLANTEEEVSFL